MYRFSTNQDFQLHDFPDPLPAVEPVGLQGYLWFGTNSSLPKVSSERRNFNLDGLPTIFSSAGYQFIDFDGANGHFKSPLATFLLCDPQARILDGQVLLSQRNTSITLLSASPINGQPKVGNISPDAANVALGLSMMEVLEVDDEEAPVRIGILAARAFTNETSQDFDESDKNPFDIGILPIEDIQRNLDLFMNPSGKALSSYFKDYEIEGTNQLFLMPVQGAIQQDKQALMTSRGLAISTISLFLCATLSLAIIFFYLRVWQTPPFKLESILLQFHEQDDEKYVMRMLYSF